MDNQPIGNVAQNRQRRLSDRLECLHNLSFLIRFETGGQNKVGEYLDLLDRALLGMNADIAQGSLLRIAVFLPIDAECRHGESLGYEMHL
jgi:hypothetical protein